MLPSASALLMHIITASTRTLMMQIFNKPAFQKLLPDPLPPTHQRPYTLLVDLDGMLVSSTWDVSAQPQGISCCSKISTAEEL